MVRNIFSNPFLGKGSKEGRSSKDNRKSSRFKSQKGKKENRRRRRRRSC
jgi:hypothetical protein